MNHIIPSVSNLSLKKPLVLRGGRHRDGGGSEGGGIERGVTTPHCTPVCCMGGGGSGLPSTISTVSWTWCEMRLDLNIGGCGDMVGWMPVQLVSGSIGCGAANVEATPRCNINI
jgi:hypothetical protein